MASKGHFGSHSKIPHVLNLVMSLSCLLSILPFFVPQYLHPDPAAHSYIARILAIMDRYLEGDWLEFEGGDTVKLTFNTGKATTFPLLV